MKANLTDLAPVEIATELGLKPFQGRQIFRWIHQRQVFDFAGMTDLSKEVRQCLADTCVASQVRLERLLDSPRSAAQKALFRLADGETVESVLLRDRDRTTLCLSTQVGCAVKCPFCATGQDGFVRNLSAGEIVEQALYLLKDKDLKGHTPNLVYMGMGEPFLNYDAVVRSVRLLMEKDGLGIGARKITVSTVGEVPGIRRFAQEDWQVRLSVSLHAVDDELRSALVPLNRKYPLAALFSAVHDYAAATGRQVSFEWTLLRGVNDYPDAAAALAARIRGLHAAVNLIPCNPVPGLPYRPPSRNCCKAFLEVLARNGVKATLRKTLGHDIDAACGQLRRQFL